MIDTTKLVQAIETALENLEVHHEIVRVTLAMDPKHGPFIHQAGKNEGATQCLTALLQGITNGTFNAEPETEPCAAPDEDDEDSDEEPTKYGVFLVFHDGSSVRSNDVDGEFDTRSEAWAAVRKDGSGRCHYEVRPL